MRNWVKYARFEQKQGYINSARSIYERAVEFFGEDNMDEQLFVAFAKFEEAQKEVSVTMTVLDQFVYFLCLPFQHERARAIYKYALDKLPKERCEDIYKQYTIHEKKHGSRAGIEDVIVNKRKFKYEEVSAPNTDTYAV